MSTLSTKLLCLCQIIRQKLLTGIFMLSTILSVATAQTTIFSENMGTPAATTAIASYTGWQNNGVLTFSGTADVRNTTVSSGYTGASGGGNIFFTNVIGRDFVISGINTSLYNSLTLSFGVYKPLNSTSGLPDLKVEVSSDGTTYTQLTYTGLPSGTGTAGWYFRTASGTIPSTSNLRIKFTQMSAFTGFQLRLDDVKLTGVCISPVTYYTDADGDGYGTGSGTSFCVNPGTAYATQAGDCNDGNAAVNPGATEICNGIDDDCDSSIDEGLTFTTYFTDADGDGYGIGSGSSLCSDPGAGYVTQGGDCNDGNPAINPGTTEVCNGVDDDCDGSIDEGLTFTTYYIDTDGDGYGTGSGSSFCSEPGAGYVTQGGDCNDGNPAINPGTTEVCNGVDDDCDGSIDEGLTFVTYYVDADGDGYGIGSGSSLCSDPGAGYTTQGGDCNDANSSINPAAAETCDGVDNDCDGTVDEGCGNTNIDYVNLQFPENANILQGGTITAYAQVYVAGLTDATSGQASGINAWIGYSAVNENPNSASFTWVPASFNTESGNNDEYQATFGANLPAGTYYYASRFQRNGGAYYYGGYPFGSWNGTTSNNGVLTVTALPTNIDYVNLQFPSSATIFQGSTMTAYAQVYVAGLTDATSGQASGINAWIGYSSINENPNSASFTWVPATFNVESGNNDEYQATFGADLPFGTYYYASRFQRNGGDYYYGGNPFGSWNGTSSISGVLTVTCANPTTYYVDTDGDGYGTGTGTSSCTNLGVGYTTQAGDCDDNNSSVNPGATEQCNGIDDDCDGQTDEGFTDTDADGSADCVDADDDNDGTNDGIDCAPLDASVQTPPAAVSPITGSDLICYGQTITLSTLSTGGVWSSSDPAVASIDQSGVVTANTAGTVTIQYTLTNSCGSSSASYTVTVNPQITLSTSVTNVTCPGGSNGAVNLTVSGGTPNPAPVTITQDFNSLVNSGTSTVLPSGWFIAEAGTGANTTYTAGAGSSTTGDTYSLGSSGSTDRALGGLRSGSLNPTFGASFTNTTGATVNKIDITYTGEQWRLAVLGRQDRIDFQYSTNATSLTTGTWTDFNTLDFSSPNTTGSTTLDGNNASNRTTLSGSITGLNIPNDGKVWIRWTDIDISGSDDALGVDDFSITLGSTAFTSTTPYSYLWSSGSTTEDISSVSANTYSVTVTDSKNCTATTSANVITQDLIAPVVATKNISVNLDANGSALIDAADINNGSTDNCGTANLVSVTPSSFSCSDAVYIKDLFISEYVEGNSTNKAIEIYNGTSASINLNQYRVKIYSNGGTTPSSTTNLTGTISAGGTHVLASTASALFSFANQISSNINFNGNDAVVLETTSGQVIDVIGKIGQDPGVEWGTGSVTTLDKTLRRKISVRSGDADGSNDFVPSVEWEAFAIDNFSDLGKHIVGTPVTLTVSDPSGNTSTGTAIVTVKDPVIPTITAPAAVNISADNGLCVATNISLGDATTADNCGVASVTNDAPSSYAVGTTTVTWTVTDVHGNTATATQDVVVTDNQNPTMTAPATVNVSADNGSCAATSVILGDATTADNCGVASVTNDAPSSYPVGTTIVTWTVTDIHGNTATANQDVVVIDDQNPTITAPATVNVNADNGSCAATSVTLGDATTADNCGVASVTNDAPATYPVGTTTVTWTVTDIHGNTAIATQDVVVTDDQNPTITAPATVNVNADSGSCAVTNVPLGTPSTADNCGVASVTNDAPATFPVGTTTVTWTVTDIHGNTAIATQDVVVTDDQNPTITAPATVNVNADSGSCASTSVTLGDATTADNCGVASVTNDAPASYPVGTTTITWTVTDIHGNSTTTTQNVVVTDNQLPIITCPANITTSTDEGLCTKSITISSATATDNCGIATNGITGVRNDGLALDAPYPFGVTTITWTATDVNGNQSSCNQMVTVSQVTTITSVTVTPGTQQYSDRVTFTATVTPNGCPAAGDVGGNVTFRIGTQVMGTAPILSGVATLSDVALLEPLPSGTLPIGQMMPGVKNVTATVGGTDADYLVNNAATTFTITKENAIADYTGQEFASTGSATATTAPVRLSATVRDITAVDPLGDAHAGVIRNAKARFIIRTLNPTNMSVTSTSRTRWLQVNLLGTDTRVGSILLDTIFNIGTNNSLPYEIGVEVDSFYTSSTGSIASLVVSKTVNDFVTYGGNILMNPNTSSGLYPSNTGSRLNFGGQAKWNKNGTNLQGGVNMIWRTGTKVYQVKGIVGGSNGSLSVNTSISTNRRATIVAKANVFDTETGLTVPNTNGSTITINLRDRGEPGRTDSIAIEVRNSAGQLVYSSNWTGIRTNERMLNGGNIQISGSNISTPSIRKADDPLITPITKVIFDLRVLGNPSETQFGLQPISSDKLGRMVIRVTDVNGRLVEQFDQLKEGQTLLIGDSYRQGIYFAELIQGEQRKVLRLMKLK